MQAPSAGPAEPAAAETGERLRRAGAALRRRPAVEIVERLAAVLDTWRDPGSPPRRRLQAELPAVTGFSAETVEAGLALALEGWSGSALRELVRRELGPEPRTGADFTALILAGAIPTPTLLAMLAPLVLRSPVWVKTSVHDPLTAEVVRESLAAEDPELAAAVTIQQARGDDPRLEPLLKAPCVVAYGSDRTLDRIAARIPPSTRLVGYGHRVSFAVLGPETGDASALSEALTGCARDVAMWDQLGCLSPVALFVVTGGGPVPERIVDQLAGALERAEERWPRGRVETAAAAAIAQERAEAELRAAAGAAVRMRRGAGSRWTLVAEPDARPRPQPLHRFLRVHPLADASELPAALAASGCQLAGVALAGFDAAGERRLAGRLHASGASRVCRFGWLQAPPLDWVHDHPGVLTPLREQP